MSNFIPVDRKTDYLFPPSVEDWLPENHLARFILEVIERLDLTELTRQYAGRGSSPHHPAVLLVLLMYGYATGVPSSHKIERAAYDSMAFRYIAANTHPDHDTLLNFRRRFGAQLEQLFTQVLMLAREMGMLKLGAGGFDPCNNAQAVVDTGSMLIVGSFVTQACNDSRQVQLMLEVLQGRRDQIGQPKHFVANTGFFSAANVTACAQAGIVPLIAMKREAQHEPVLERFTEPPPRADDTVTSMVHQLKTQSGRSVYALRKQTVEPVFDIIKHVMKFRQFLLHGVARVGHEWNVVALAWNLKRMNALKMA